MVAVPQDPWGTWPPKSTCFFPRTRTIVMGTSRSFASLVARVILGIIFIFHGWQKLHTNGIDATEAYFKSLDIPWPAAAAWYSALVEFGGGILLILGVL